VKTAAKFFYGFLSIFMFAVVLCSAGMAAPVALGLGIGGSALLSLHTKAQSGAAQSLVLLELWDQELIKNFRHTGSWVNEIPRKDEYVMYNAVNLVQLGVDPDVLINNTTYPIAVQQIDDDTVIITLGKYQTKATPVTDDEMIGIPYDKEGSLLERHRLTVEELSRRRLLHALAPAADSASTPLVYTTGDDNGSGFKRCTPQDIIDLAKRYADAGIPMDQWRLVLSNQHIADLLHYDVTLNTRMQNNADGSIMPNFYGFKTFRDIYTPTYAADGTLNAWGAAPVGTDMVSSIAFAPIRSWQAAGFRKTYYSPAAQDPLNQRSLFNIRVHHGGGKTKAEGFGGILSAPVV